MIAKLLNLGGAYWLQTITTVATTIGCAYVYNEVDWYRSRLSSSFTWLLSHKVPTPFSVENEGRQLDCLRAKDFSYMQDGMTNLLEIIMTTLLAMMIMCFVDGISAFGTVESTNDKPYHDERGTFTVVAVEEESSGELGKNPTINNEGSSSLASTASTVSTLIRIAFSFPAILLAIYALVESYRKIVPIQEEPFKELLNRTTPLKDDEYLAPILGIEFSFLFFGGVFAVCRGLLVLLAMCGKVNELSYDDYKEHIIQIRRIMPRVLNCTHSYFNSCRTVILDVVYTIVLLVTIVALLNSISSMIQLMGDNYPSDRDKTKMSKHLVCVVDGHLATDNTPSKLAILFVLQFVYLPLLFSIVVLRMTPHSLLWKLWTFIRISKAPRRT